MTRAPVSRSSRASTSGHGHAATDSGQQFRRSRIQLRRIPDEKQRRCTFQKRKKGLLKKADELSKMCDVQLCLFCTGHPDPELDDKNDVTFSWSVPSASVDELLDRYEATPQEQRDKKKLDYVSHLDMQIKKTEKESENIKQLNANLEDEISKKLAMDMQSIFAVKLRLDARIRELTEQQQGGIAIEGDRYHSVQYQQELPSSYMDFPNANQDFNPGGFPPAIPGMLQQYGTANLTLESRFESSNDPQSQYGSDALNLFEETVDLGEHSA